MAFLRLAPWTSVSSQRGSLDGEGTEEVGRSFSRRGEAPAVGAPLGKSERGTRATFGGAWGSRWWPVVASPRRGAAGGGLVRGGGVPGGPGRRRAGRGAPAEVKGACYGVRLAQERVEG